jgi:signal transduction histidine kinase/ligand-binding sensor domain-containing protein/DNA-binding response OmpR family regulator
MNRLYKALFFVLSLPVIAHPQYQHIKFENLSVEQGLSHTTVKCIFQDSKGFMWFGTEDGLNKFDGYNFAVYRYDPADSTSLSFNEILDIYEDRSGNLWIATCGGGINRFDRETESFVRYIYDRENPKSIAHNSTWCITSFIYEEKEILWIGTSLGLVKFDPETEQFTHLPHTGNGWPFSWIRGIDTDSAGNVWLASMADGLHKFDPETGQYTSFRHDPTKPNSLSNSGVISVCRDKSEVLWVGTKDGLNRFQTETESFISYSIDTNYRQTPDGNWIFSIREDHLGTLWLGTGAGGLKAFNRQTAKLTSYMHDPGDAGSISDNTVMCIFEDKAGLIWAGTWRGINIIDHRKAQFVDIKPHPDNSNSLSGNFIWSICGSNYKGKSSLWIGTKANGINKLNLTNGIIERFKHDPGNPNSIPSDFIFSLCEDRSGTLWIGTYGHGLIKYDPQLKKFFSYVHDLDNPRSISNNIIFRIIEDSNGNLWMGTQGGGLNRFEKKTNEFTCFFRSSAVTNIYEDRSGKLWLAGSGLRKLDPNTGKFKRYRHNPKNPLSISSNYTTVIYETFENARQVIWVGTYSSGLNRFDPESEKFKCYTIDDGLPSNTINGILEDHEKNLWLSTNNGISRFNPQNETFTNFDITDGLLDNKFNVRACSKAADGQLFFGSTKGLVAFYPDQLKKNHHVPEIVFTDFRIFNKPVGIKKNNSNFDQNSYLLEKHISELREIELSYRENVFSFEFAALDYSAPDKNMYAYKMEGVDPDWVYTDASRRFATYTNLDPGEYIFKAKGSNNDGIWNEDGTLIKIVITPPWWKSDLAYAIYIFLLISIVITTWRVQLRRIRLKQQLKMEHFEAEKLREVDQLKSRFFANISHEFRTPLTLIKGPVKQMLIGEFIGNVKDQYKMILRNSDRLLGLINQILDLSKLESGEMKLQVSETDIIPYLRGLILSFSPLADRKKITMNFNTDDDIINEYIDRDKIEKIVTNLLSNAFKFTPENGTISIRICTDEAFPGKVLSKTETSGRNASPQQTNIQYPTSNIIKITISNTGPGIPTDQIDKIFDRFYQADSTYKKDGESSGIGLALTKELVEVCHGEITVSSTPNENTTFTVSLPISKEHFKENEIVKEPETADSVTEAGDRRPETEESSVEISSYTSNPNTSIEHSRQKTSPSGRSVGMKSSKISQASSIEDRGSRILIVEDNPDVTSYIYSFLDQQYRIMTAENGKEGLKKVLDKYPDLIISDVMMPEMDGFEFCQKVKHDERISHIPVILLTAKADLESKIEGLEFGADDYVTKPFEARELLIRVKNLIEQRRKLREKFTALVDLNPADIAASSMDEQLLNRLLAVFEDHMEEPDFSIEQLAREIGMSRSHLNRKIQALTNVSTSEFIRTLRLQRAARMLTHASGTISEIAYKVGFNNLSYFSKAFRKHFGKLPSELYKKE